MPSTPTLREPEACLRLADPDAARDRLAEIAPAFPAGFLTPALPRPAARPRRPFALPLAGRHAGRRTASSPCWSSRRTRRAGHHRAAARGRGRLRGESRPRRGRPPAARQPGGARPPGRPGRSRRLLGPRCGDPGAVRLRRCLGERRDRGAAPAGHGGRALHAAGSGQAAGRVRADRPGAGQARRLRAELFERHRPRRLLRGRARRGRDGRGSEAVLRQARAGLGEAPGRPDRGRLRPPRRLPAAARPGLHRGGALHRLRLRLLPDARPELGAGGLHQGPADRRRHPGRRRRSSPNSRRSSGGGTSTFRPSPRSTP